LFSTAGSSSTTRILLLMPVTLASGAAVRSCLSIADAGSSLLTVPPTLRQRRCYRRQRTSAGVSEETPADRSELNSDPRRRAAGGGQRWFFSRGKGHAVAGMRRRRSRSSGSPAPRYQRLRRSPSAAAPWYAGTLFPSTRCANVATAWLLLLGGK